MNLLVILLLCIWIFLAIRYVKKHKNGCSGNCLSCLCSKRNIKTRYDQDKRK